jgi:hypothetical protein
VTIFSPCLSWADCMSNISWSWSLMGRVYAQCAATSPRLVSHGPICVQHPHQIPPTPGLVSCPFIVMYHMNQDVD